MNGHAAVDDGGVGTREHGAKLVIELVFVGVRSDPSILAREISHLTSLRKGVIAGRDLSPLEGVKMGQSLGAVSVIGDSTEMDVVDYPSMVSNHWLLVTMDMFILTERAALLGKVGELDVVQDTNSIRAGLNSDGTIDVAIEAAAGEERLLWKGGISLLAYGVVFDDSGIAQKLSEENKLGACDGSEPGVSLTPVTRV